MDLLTEISRSILLECRQPPERAIRIMKAHVKVVVNGALLIFEGYSYLTDSKYCDIKNPDVLETVLDCLADSAKYQVISTVMEQQRLGKDLKVYASTNRPKNTYPGCAVAEVT